MTVLEDKIKTLSPERQRRVAAEADRLIKEELALRQNKEGNSMKLKLTGKEARSIVYEEHKDWKQVEEKITDTSRWSVHYEAIHRHLPSGKCYAFYYSRGATECQDESPYEYDDEVEVDEVHQVEKLVKLWEPVE